MAPRFRRYIIVAGIVIVGLVADQLSKSWAVRNLDAGRTVSLLPTLEFDLSYNSGFSFSTGSGQGRLIGIGVIVLCGFLVHRIHQEADLKRVSLLAAILAGALGNLADRLLRSENGFLSGHVVDFIDVSWFAVFNVADILVVGGAILYAGLEYFELRRVGLTT